MNRPTTAPELSVTRPACPPWCEHVDACQVGSFQGRPCQVTATAAMPTEFDVTPIVDTVDSFLCQDSIDPAPYVYLDGHRMRVHEVRTLIGQLQEYVGALEGAQGGRSAPTPAAVATCPVWCTCDHSTDVFVGGEGPAHSVTLLNQTEDTADHDHRMVQVGWTPWDEAHSQPYVWTDFNGVEAEMTADEARSFAVAMRRSLPQWQVSQALLEAAAIVDKTIQGGVR